MRMIGGYSVAQLEVMIRQQKAALIQEAATLKREISARETRLKEIVDRLDDLERSENVLLLP